ncbi:MAG: hypothetical protein CVU98_02520 [Firmicutes bacterium HGW-Firmicutes-3]|jgi:DNA-binding LytR/AlgR family response regulator|nr:MAG: hypothetical protein CVU98_02520 [Firmicutes bacterium HGW-Firmicutes-3]
MTLLILEDEQEISEQIKEAVCIKKLFDYVLKATTIKEALNMSKKNEVSIFIVDLLLPDGNGYEFIEAIRELPQYELAWVVIVTGIKEPTENILDAYNNSKCNRYIRKPFSMNYLTDMLEELIYKKVIVQDQLTKLKIRRKSRDYFFDHSEIVYIETVDKVAYIYTKRERHPIGRVTLCELEEQLPKEQFIRVHRSYIVNLLFIDYVNKNNSQSMIKIKHYENMIPIGRTYKENYNLFL